MAVTREYKAKPINELKDIFQEASNQYQLTSELKEEKLKTYVLINVFINQVIKLDHKDPDVNRSAMVLGRDALGEISKVIHVVSDDQGTVEPLLQKIIVIFLRQAIFQGDLGCVKFVLENNLASPFVIDPESGKNLLHLAAENNHMIITEYLASNFPRLLVGKDNNAHTPDDVANNLNHKDIKEKLKAIYSKLFDDVESIPAEECNFEKIFYLAETLRQTHCLARLLPNYYENSKNIFFKFVVLAISTGWIEVIDWIVPDNLKYDVTDSNGNNILHLAVMYGSEEVIEYIVNHHSELMDLQNKKNELATTIARNLGRNDNLVEFLRPNRVKSILTRCNDKPSKKLILSEHKLNENKSKELVPIDPMKLENLSFESKATQDPGAVMLKVPKVVRVEEMAPTITYKAEFIIAESDLKFGDKLFDDGVVYEGTYRSQEVVLKRFYSSECFTMESNFNYMIFQNPHCNVIHPFGICTSPRTLVMERACYDLEDAILNEEIVMTQGDVVVYALHAARGLEYLHEYGIVHRDVKPRNILVCQADKKGSAVAKICDFGLSIMGEEYKPDQCVQGTSPYMAPEIYGKQYYSPKSDMWAFGLTCWELIARSPSPLVELVNPKNTEDTWTKIAATLKTVSMESYLPKVNSFPKFVTFALSFFHQKPNQRPSSGMAVTALEDMLIGLSPEERNKVVPINNITVKR